MAFEYVNDYYGVNACLGRIAVVNGKKGVIAEDKGHYIGVNFDHHDAGDISICHPTWEVEYLGIGPVRVKRLTRSQRRYQEYLSGVYYDAGHTFAYFLGIKGSQ
jgi:hypothetical protein